MMADPSYIVLVCLVIGVLGDENTLCTKRIRSKEGSVVTYREEWGCCAGYIEVNGDQLCSKCTNWTYGYSCRHRCRCIQENTRYCDHITGSCLCHRYWTGQTCAIPSYLFIVKRQATAPPPTTIPPAPTTMASICVICEPDNTDRCDTNSGCVCKTGWQGTDCKTQTTTPATTTIQVSICGSCTQANTASCTTSCICKEGWTGVLCNIQSVITTTPEPPTTFPSDPCVSCSSTNTASCNSNSNTGCVCNAGWGGTLCEDESSPLTEITRSRSVKACAAWTYGSGCKTCDCVKSNSVSCNSITGACTCAARYWGTFCSDPCPCPELASSSCNDATGQCVCTEGYIGNSCDSICSAFFFGLNCSSRCTCTEQLTASCHHVTGACTCLPGYTGSTCEQTCGLLTYGQDCALNCSCNATNAKGCDSITGICDCNAGWTVNNCNETCSTWTYGENCGKNCECNQTNSHTCDHVTGQCVCNPGYQGSICNDACLANFYGEGCLGVCACDKNLSISCDHVTGQCQCITGYDKPHCNTTCPAGLYGDQCSSTCDCPSTAYSVCHHITGACTCKPGYIGDTCQTECAENTYGVNCLGVCDCLAVHTSYCDTGTGVCVCDSGWEGTRCDTASALEALISSPAVISVISVVVTLLLMLAILFILWKICRCSCTEVRHRSHKDKGAVILMNSPIVPGSNNSAISAMAAATTQLKHDGIYYYSADLKKATDSLKDVPDSPKSTKDADTYYYGGIPVAPPPTSVAISSNPKAIGTGNDNYYDDGEVSALVVTSGGKLDTKTAPSNTGPYQNVSSLAARTTNAPVTKISHPPLPLPPVPPVVLPSRRMVLPQASSIHDIPKSTATGYGNVVAETSFGSMPTYGNTGRQLPQPTSDSSYETLDRHDTGDTSGVYAELK